MLKSISLALLCVAHMTGAQSAVGPDAVPSRSERIEQRSVLLKLSAVKKFSRPEADLLKAREGDLLLFRTLFW